jgi:hypothetical protein
VDLYEVATFTLIPASDKRGEKNAGVRWQSLRRYRRNLDLNSKF